MNRLFTIVFVSLSLSGCASRENDLQTMNAMSNWFVTLAKASAVKGDGPLTTSHVVWGSCIFAREMAYVKGDPPPLQPKSEINKTEGLAIVHDIRSGQFPGMFQADARLEFDEAKYEEFVQRLPHNDADALKSIRSRYGYFEKLKKDYE